METVARIDTLGCVDLPDGLGWAMAQPQPDTGALFPEERAAMARAVPTRVAEFTGGRVAARAALARIGLPPVAIPVGDDRAPAWPEGVVGSISHGGGVCVAVVGRAAAWRGLGVDLEPDAPLPPDLVAEIAVEAELAALAPMGQGHAATRVFSAKEAAYKAQYPETRAVFGFDAMRADLPTGVMRMVQDTGPGLGAELPIRQQVFDGMILSLCLVPQPVK